MIMLFLLRIRAIARNYNILEWYFFRFYVFVCVAHASDITSLIMRMASRRIPFDQPTSFLLPHGIYPFNVPLDICDFFGLWPFPSAIIIRPRIKHNKYTNHDDDSNIAHAEIRTHEMCKFSELVGIVSTFCLEIFHYKQLKRHRRRRSLQVIYVNVLIVFVRFGIFFLFSWF